MATLETPRLILREWRDEDVDAWAAMSADPRVMEHFPSTYNRTQSEASAQRFRANLEHNGYGWWPIEVKNGAKFAGVIVLQEIPFAAHFTPATEVGWWLAYEHWGHAVCDRGRARRARLRLRHAGPFGDRRDHNARERPLATRHAALRDDAQSRRRFREPVHRSRPSPAHPRALPLER